MVLNKMATILFKTEHQWKTECHWKTDQRVTIGIQNTLGILAPTVLEKQFTWFAQLLSIMFGPEMKQYSERTDRGIH